MWFKLVKALPIHKQVQLPLFLDFVPFCSLSGERFHLPGQDKKRRIGTEGLDDSEQADGQEREQSSQHGGPRPVWPSSGRDNWRLYKHFVLIPRYFTLSMNRWDHCSIWHFLWTDGTIAVFDTFYEQMGPLQYLTLFLWTDGTIAVFDTFNEQMGPLHAVISAGFESF